jgi:hypothetical protein
MIDITHCTVCKKALNKATGAYYFYCPNYNVILADQYEHDFVISNYYIRLSLRNVSLKQSYELHLIDDKWYDKSESIIIGDVNTPIQHLMQNSQILDLFK